MKNSKEDKRRRSLPVGFYESSVTQRIRKRHRSRKKRKKLYREFYNNWSKDVSAKDVRSYFRATGLGVAAGFMLYEKIKNMKKQIDEQ